MGGGGGAGGRMAGMRQLGGILGLAAAFGAGVWLALGREAGEEWLAGYLLEQSLSVDNLLVFVLVFDYFKVEEGAQKNVLNYGIWGAAIFRAVFVLLGAELLENFEGVLLLFAGILIFSSYKILAGGDEDEEADLQNNAVVKLCRRVITVSDEYDGDRFFTLAADGARIATPLLLVLTVIELSDLVFAVDSIPAVFGVTRDPFIVYSSNLLAILSLRSLYSLVSSGMSELEYLEKAVGVVLGFIGLKMVAGFGGLEISTGLSLSVVCALLAGGVGLSVLLPASGTEYKE